MLYSLPEVSQKLRESIQQYVVDKARLHISFYAFAVHARVDGFTWSGFISFKK